MVLNSFIFITERHFVPGIDLLIVPVRILAHANDPPRIKHYCQLPDQQIAVWIFFYSIYSPLIGLLKAFLRKHFVHFVDQLFDFKVSQIFVKRQQDIKGNMQ